MKILPLVGYKSLRALNGFHVLLLGLNMLPAYIGKGYEKFYASFKEKTEDEKEAAIREAVLFVELKEEEVRALVSFACDSNGIPYGDTNIKNLSPKQLHEIIVAVCMEIGRIEIELVSEEEKKKLVLSQSTCENNI